MRRKQPPRDTVLLLPPLLVPEKVPCSASAMENGARTPRRPTGGWMRW